MLYLKVMAKNDKNLQKLSVSYMIDQIPTRKRNLKRALLNMLQRLFILDGTICLLLNPFDPAIYNIATQKLHSQICEMDSGSWQHKSYTIADTTAGTQHIILHII